VGDKSNTWGELEDAASRIAKHLVDQGVQRGDRIIVHQSNTLDYLQVILGIAWAGAITVPILSIISPDELKYIIAEIEPAAVIDPVNQAGELMMSERCDPNDGTGQSISQILFTSGSSGRPKGVVHYYESTAAAMEGWLSVSGMSQFDVTLVSTPISHASGRLFEAVLLTAATVVLSRSSRAEDILCAIETTQTSHMILVPTVLAELVNHERFTEHDVTSLRFLMYASAPASPTLIMRAQELFGPIIHTVYGSTEAPAPITHLDPSDHLRATTTNQELLLSCGREFRWGCQIQIVNEAREPVADGELGQMAIWTPALAATYWNQPELWDQRIDAGWFLTGDIARREQGFIYLADREDDMIITGGFNVFPTEVENHIVAHSLVSEVVVFGLPDSRWGEAVVAIVSGKSDLTERVIRDWCQNHLSRHKIPKQILIVDALPKNGHGKVSRRGVREYFYSDAELINGAG
jgi:acyl-CoA synthetase (AMP-forming)/AMP-acid ligase II